MSDPDYISSGARSRETAQEGMTTEEIIIPKRSTGDPANSVETEGTQQRLRCRSSEGSGNDGCMKSNSFPTTVSTPGAHCICGFEDDEASMKTEALANTKRSGAYHNSSSEEDEDSVKTKITSNLSNESIPGAYHSIRVTSGHTATTNLTSKPSQEQMFRMARLRSEQKIRASHIPMSEEENVKDHSDQIDDLQVKMNEFMKVICEEDQAEKKSERQRRRKRQKSIAVILLVSINIAVVVGLTVGILIPPRGNMDADSTEDAARLERCTYEKNAEFMSGRYNRVRSIILSFDESLETSIDTPDSPARAAVCWIAEADNFSSDLAKSELHVLVERFAMAVLYYQFSAADLRALSNFMRARWLSELSVCEWDLIGCTGGQGETIDKLSLSLLDLHGSIPSELGVLTDLTYLDIAENFITGIIPSHLFRLSQLEFLNLGTNLISGTIPEAIGTLTALRHIGIGPSSLSSTVPNLDRLYNLTVLALKGGGFKGKFPVIPSATNLESLVLEDGFFTGSIPAYTWGFTNLKVLKLKSTSLTGTIPTEIGLLTNLKIMILSSGMYGTIPTELGNLSSIEQLDIAFNRKLTSTIPSELGQLSRLESLKLEYLTFVSGTMPSEICALRQISLTYLSARCIAWSCDCCTFCEV